MFRFLPLYTDGQTEAKQEDLPKYPCRTPPGGRTAWTSTRAGLLADHPLTAESVSRVLGAQFP